MEQRVLQQLWIGQDFTPVLKVSDDLCNFYPSVVRKLCAKLVDPKALSVFVTGRLIALKKKPGVRNIGIGKVSRMIIERSC